MVQRLIVDIAAQPNPEKTLERVVEGVKKMLHPDDDWD